MGMDRWMQRLGTYRPIRLSLSAEVGRRARKGKRLSSVYRAVTDADNDETETEAGE